MKLPKNTTVYHKNKKYIGEIPDEYARELGLQKPEPKKAETKPKK